MDKLDNIDSIYDAIRDRIFELLDEKDISQKEFAIRLGVSPQTVTDWKKGKSRSFTTMLGSVSDVLDTTPAWLYGGVGLRSMTKEEKERDSEIKLMMLEERSQFLHQDAIETVARIAPYAALDTDFIKKMADYLNVTLDEVFIQIKENTAIVDSKPDYLVKFSSLSSDDQDEVVAIIEMKLTKQQQKPYKIGQDQPYLVMRYNSLPPKVQEEVMAFIEFKVAQQEEKK